VPGSPAGCGPENSTVWIRSISGVSISQPGPVHRYTAPAVNKGKTRSPETKAAESSRTTTGNENGAWTAARRRNTAERPCSKCRPQPGLLQPPGHLVPTQGAHLLIRKRLEADVIRTRVSKVHHHRSKYAARTPVDGGYRTLSRGAVLDLWIPLVDEQGLPEPYPVTHRHQQSRLQAQVIRSTQSKVLQRRSWMN
jgi:hypothetical protein